MFLFSTPQCTLLLQRQQVQLGVCSSSFTTPPYIGRYEDTMP